MAPALAKKRYSRPFAPCPPPGMVIAADKTGKATRFLHVTSSEADSVAATVSVALSVSVSIAVSVSVFGSSCLCR